MSAAKAICAGLALSWKRSGLPVLQGAELREATMDRRGKLAAGEPAGADRALLPGEFLALDDGGERIGQAQDAAVLGHLRTESTLVISRPMVGVKYSTTCGPRDREGVGARAERLQLA